MASDSTTDEIALRAEIEALRRKVASLEATASDRGAQLIRFEMLVRHAPICIHEIDLDGKLTSMNPAGLEMMNAHEEAEVRGLRYLDVVAQPDRERVGALLSKAFGGSASSFDFRAGPEDARVQLASCFIPLSDPTGKVNRLMGVSEDVTQRRHHVEELAQRNEELVRWAHIFEYARVPMIVSEAEPFIRMANPAAAELYGYTTEQMRGMPIAALLRDDDVTAVRGMADATDGDGVFHLDAIHVRGDGSEFPVGGTLTAVHGDDDTVVYRVAVLRDLTEEKATEASRVRLLQQFQQAQKLESLGLLAGGIAHDFNNMLVGILVNTGLAQMAAPTGGDLARLLAETEHAALRAAELTNQMLVYAGRRQRVLESVDLNQLVRDIVQLLKAALPAQATIDYHFASDLPRLRVDATQIRQVVMNLVTNAGDALGGEPGTITLTTGKLTMDRNSAPSALVEGPAPDGRYVFVDVTDTGHGMDADTQQRIFDPFFTTKPTGRGLGLAAVLGILRAHRGSVMLRSHPSEGTGLRVLLPASEETGAVTQRPPVTGQGSLDGKTVLVVDDEEVVRRVVTRVLERSGARTLIAANGRAAITLYRGNKDIVDAVFMDLRMPVMGGLEALAELQLISPDLPVLLSSGYAAGSGVNSAVVSATVNFLPKPFTPAQLREGMTALV